MKGTKVEEKVLYERAKRLQATGRTQAARDAYLEVATKWPYPFGGFWDDALFRAATMDEKLGRTNDALAELELLLSRREVAGFMGSYERPRYLSAIEMIARIHEKNGDPREGS